MWVTACSEPTTGLRPNGATRPDAMTIDATALDASPRDAGAPHDAGAPDAAPSRDAASTTPETGPAPDVGVCPGVRLVDVPAMSMSLVDPIPPNTERSFRVRLPYALTNGCLSRAMPNVTVRSDARTVTISLRAWEELGRPCPELLQMDERIVLLRLPTPGDWTITGGAATLTLTVGVPPPRACGLGPGASCQMDCDCPDAKPCLSGFGAAGPFTACRDACEHDMDCPNGGRCTSIPDGLESTCDTLAAQCDAATDCPRGYRCTGGRCSTSFTLGGALRRACSCNSDCDSPLACAHARDPAGTRRCELPCGTGGPRWCGPAHICGEAGDDVAGLAATDAVCGWVGD